MFPGTHSVDVFKDDSCIEADRIAEGGKGTMGWFLRSLQSRIQSHARLQSIR